MGKILCRILAMLSEIFIDAINRYTHPGFSTTHGKVDQHCGILRRELLFHITRLYTTSLPGKRWCML
jgi:hypothetical protein